MGNNFKAHDGINFETFNDVGGNQINNNYGADNRTPVLSQLKPYVAYNAEYNSRERMEQDASACGPETRTEVLEKIWEWVFKNEEHSLCWLSGRAGTGKSTIAHTIAQECAGKGHVALTFFFSRDVDRSDMSKLFTTFADQLARSNTKLQEFIQKAIDDDPAIFMRDFETQLEKLIIEPITKLEASTTLFVFTIDALDDCQRKHIPRLIRMLNLKASHHSNIRFLLTSRPEHHISNELDNPKVSNTYHIKLDDFDAKPDIRCYLRAGFEKIFENNRDTLMDDIEGTWPTDSDMLKIVDQSEGLFIYASTLLRFVGDLEVPGLPQEKLELALKAHRGLDGIYDQVLSACTRSPNFHTVITAIILLRYPLSIAELAKLLSLSSSHIKGSLIGCLSILVVPKAVDKEIRLYHSSLADFLLDPDRSKTHHIRPIEHHAAILYRCINLINPVHLNASVVDDGDSIVYACRHWCYHLHSVVSNSQGITLLESNLYQLKAFLLLLGGDLLEPWIKCVQNRISDIRNLETSTCTIIETLVRKFLNLAVSEYNCVQVKSHELRDLVSPLQKVHWRIKCRLTMEFKIGDVDSEKLTRDDVIIVVTGLTGVGKSNLIDKAVGQDHKRASQRVQPYTEKVQAVYIGDTQQGRRIVLIDTPGFDDSKRSDMKLFKLITEWMHAEYKKRIKLSGLLYLHRIADPRMSGTLMKNLDMFVKLWGDDLKHVVLVTTMWDEVEQGIAESREEQLIANFWRDILEGGSTAHRFHNTSESAWKLLEPLLNRTGRECLLQHTQSIKPDSGVTKEHSETDIAFEGIDANPESAAKESAKKTSIHQRFLLLLFFFKNFTQKLSRQNDGLPIPSDP